MEMNTAKPKAETLKCLAPNPSLKPDFNIEAIVDRLT